MKYSYHESFLESLKKIKGPFEFICPEESLAKIDFFKNYVPQEKNLIFKKTFNNEKTSEIVDLLMEKSELFKLGEAFSDFEHYVVTVVTELVRNGIVLNFKQMDFKDVNLCLYDEGDSLLLTVTDFYGTLNSTDISERLNKVSLTGEYERKVYGAGLGLFMAIKNVDLIKFSVCPEKYTIITASMKKYKRLKNFKEKKPILIFEEKDL